MEIIRAAGLAESRWLNGAGRKADIASGPGWLVGYAWLDRDAAFSDYADHDRTITLLEGHGFTLALPEGALLTLDRPDHPAAFDGKGPIQCRLLGGPCIVLNAITEYPGLSHTVQVVRAADLAGISGGDRVFLAVLHGSITVGRATAEPRDALRLTDPSGLRPAADAVVAVVRIEVREDQVTEDEET